MGQAALADGWVFNIQRFSIHDGPGIRTTVFLKGCPLRCEWCHNPEGWERQPQIRLAPALCGLCGRCMTVCGHGGHNVSPEGHVLTTEECVACGQCVEVCPGGALELVGKRMSAEDVMAVVRRDIPFYEQSNGGMTLSGGEPLAQAHFSEALLRLARAEGIHNAVETSAYGPWNRIAPLLGLVDLWMVDLKHTDDARHRVLTGVPNETILRNIRRLAPIVPELILRVPWVPERNVVKAAVGDGFLDELIAYVLDLSPRPSVELMPYHRLGLGKWESLGKPATMPADLPAATVEDVQPWLDRLRQAGIQASVT